ncbi:MAG: hypothetical protein QOF61_1825 [Acidobacteriota bacterium]|nr:hypothetical protein [Acidobacteriota bacterium]
MLGGFVTTALIIAAHCFALASGAQSDIAPFTDREAFNAASASLNVFDFEGVAPNSGFTNYKAPKSFTTGGADFHVTGGGRFGPGYISLVGAWYNAGPIYETTTGAKLVWAPPNQPGDASLDVTLPAGTTAAGADLWTAQPSVSTVEVVATTSDGRTQTITVNTQRPAGAFVGFTSGAAITSLRFAIPRGQTALILDNFTLGRSVKGRQPVVAPADGRSDATHGRDTQNEAQAAQPSATHTGQSVPHAAQPSASSAAQTPAPTAAQNAAPQTVERPPQRPAAASSRGTIAYVRGATEIRLIEPDGTGDRRLWTPPVVHKELGIHGVAWRPDGKELAFSSSHDAAVSLYDADLYAVRSDGTGFRKLTNAPDHGELARYPKGSVSVTFSNDQPPYQQAQSSAGIFIVYVAGADEPQQITLPPGATKTVVFNKVADFGNTAQAIVAIWGNYRWFMPGLDVRAGSMTKAPNFSITGDGIEYFGAFRPVWRSDGSRISYRTGTCTLNNVPANPVPGEYVFHPPFGGKQPLGTCAWDWGPNAATANQIIYTENATGESAVFRITEGGTHPGTKLTVYSEIEYQLLLDLRWLPDGSGFLFSNQTLERDSANIFRYDFATRKVTQVTHLENEFARKFSVSPDGQWIVFERAKSADDDAETDLWIVGVDGPGMRLLARNASDPSWGAATISK